MRFAEILSAAVILTIMSPAVASEGETRYFNKYILLAVEQLAATRAGLGYDNSSYTQDLSFNTVHLKATHPPFTMCVAAQIEVMTKAFELYANEMKDTKLYDFLQLVQWRAIRAHTFRGMVWIADAKTSRGTAHALDTFGMGKEMPFSQLTPGAFINLNRAKSGHAVIFLGYLDKEGNLLETYSPSVAGFKYFSSQGTRENGGFGYRYAFFEKSGCPKLREPDLMKRDCGVRYSDNQQILNTGQMLMPAFWSKELRDAALKADALAPKGGPPPEFNFSYFNGITTDED